jgi:4-hydroxy 2-oxovalerate aldolase
MAVDQRLRVRLTDSTLRDGSNAIRHRFTPDQVAEIAGGLDRAGMHTISVGHGEGLGASSLQYGQGLHPDDDLVAAAAAAIERADLAVIMLPGIGTKRHIESARERGATMARVSTHCTEADVGIQHIGLARSLGMEVYGDLMMSHMASPATLAVQARIMQDAGAGAVYLMDSAGAMTMDEVRARVASLREALDVPVGLHGHNNHSLAVANTIAAIEEGASLADACLGGLGAGAGNCQMEALVAVLERLGIETGIDLWALQDLADHVVRPLMTRPPTIDRSTLTLGYAGVASTFLLPADRAAARFGVDARDLMVEVGRRRAVAGQEDLLIEIASGLSEEEGRASSPTHGRPVGNAVDRR